MLITHFTAECFPLSKTGGLGDVCGALPRYQTENGNRAEVITPYHHSGYARQTQWKKIDDFVLPFNGKPQNVEIWQDENPLLGYALYAVKSEGIFPREQIYGNDDDVERYLFFQKAALEWLLHRPEKPEVLHAHDHHSGFVPLFAKHLPRYEKLAHLPTVLTIHNGNYTSHPNRKTDENLMLIPAEAEKYVAGTEWVDALRTGVLAADAVTTVSEGYLSELLGEPSPLGTLLKQQQGKAHGIVNGIDTATWNPATDAALPHTYTAQNLEGKQQNKNALCAKYGLNPQLPLVVFIGRMVHEKGLEYMLPALQQLLQEGIAANFLVVGAGNAEFEKANMELQHQYPAQYAAFTGYSEPLAHQAYAAADFLLMPSLTEPCGLNQLYAMQYGTLPIVRATGGLKDTVQDIAQEGNGNGITFAQPEPAAVAQAVKRAVDLYKNQPEELQRLRRQMMEQDFSWQQSAAQYQSLYQSLIKDLKK